MEDPAFLESETSRAFVCLSTVLICSGVEHAAWHLVRLDRGLPAAAPVACVYCVRFLLTLATQDVSKGLKKSVCRSLIGG